MKCQALRNVPKLKLDDAIHEIDLKYSDFNKRSLLKKALNRYYDANIPVKYWTLEMDKDYSGDPELLSYYHDVTKDLRLSYKEGKFACFAGSYGRGKTMLTTNILKRAVEKGYSGLYINLNDIVSAVRSQESHKARKELLTTDYLVIDEFDPRHMATDAAIDFYGRVLEDILRIREHNSLPLFMCTNSINVKGIFNGAIGQVWKA